MEELENIGAKETSFSMSEDEDIPESAAEYSRMKQRAREREQELQRLIKKGEATEGQRKEAAELRKQNAPPPAKVNKQQAAIAKKDKNRKKRKPNFSARFSLAEKSGFEPERRSTRPTPLAGEPLRPLGYFSKCRSCYKIAQLITDVKAFEKNLRGKSGAGGIDAAA